MTKHYVVFEVRLRRENKYKYKPSVASDVQWWTMKNKKQTGIVVKDQSGNIEEVLHDSKMIEYLVRRHFWLYIEVIYQNNKFLLRENEDSNNKVVGTNPDEVKELKNSPVEIICKFRLEIEDNMFTWKIVNYRIPKKQTK